MEHVALIRNGGMISHPVLLASFGRKTEFGRLLSWLHIHLTDQIIAAAS
jgi:hypothetical protein